MHVVNTVTLYYQNKSPEKRLQTEKKEKKNNYLESYLQQRCQFYPFVVSVDGIIGAEVDAMLKRIATHLTTKWNQPYQWTCRYIKSRVAITLVRSTLLCIWGSQVPAHNIIIQKLQWDYEAVLHLFREITHEKTQFTINVYFMNSKTKEQKKWRPKVLFLRKILGCISPQL